MDNYEKKYKEARSRAKNLHKDAVDIGESILAKQCEIIFPELKENEGDRIKKMLIAFFSNGAEYNSFTNGISDKDILEWLEKQGDIDKASYEIAEKEKYDFVSGQFIECRKSFDDFKEDNSYWFEYVGNDTYIGRSDNILNKKFHITPRQLYRLFTQEHYYYSKENNVVNEETNAPTAYGKYVDECLNEAAKHFFSDGEDKYSVADLFYAGVRCGQSWLEKQGEQKPDDKIEPMFKPGDWIASNVSHEDYRICKILKIENGEYVIESIYGYQGHNNIKTFDKDYHVWTINDAKNGDVLACENGWSCIFKCLNDNLFSSHCFMDNEGWFCEDGGQAHTLYYGIYGEIHPATKVQRDALFEKMKEAGCTFNFEKKELEKIEFDADGLIEESCQQQADDLIDMVTEKSAIEIETPEESLCIDSKEYNEIVNDCIYGESKSDNNVELKFHEGDWIVFNGLTLYVKEVVNGFYRTISKGGIPNSYDWGIDNLARLWDIQYAEDGDVLAFKNNIGGIIICKSPTYYDTSSYCRLVNGYLINKEESGWDSRVLVPATKEQRDALEMAITNDGYKWNADKKKLLRRVADEGKSEIDYCFTKMMNGEKVSSDCSEEDENEYNHILKTLTSVVKEQETKGYNNLISSINWFKSLKERIQPKPRQEWSEEDEENLNQLHKLIVRKAYEEYGVDTDDETLYGKWLKLDNWLKSLKQQPQWKPSEEEIQALEYQVNSTYKDSWQYKASKELLEEIKKL